MITYSQKGDWKKTNSFIERALNLIKAGDLDKYGREGVEALKANTPKDTGITSESWYYHINRKKNSVAIEWCNSSKNDNVLIAILIQYGHAFQNGHYVKGVDFINPAMKDTFDDIAKRAWKEMTE